MLHPTLTPLGEALSRYGLLVYFLVYAALAFGWRSLVVYRNTGVNPFVLPPATTPTATWGAPSSSLSALTQPSCLF